MDGSDCAYGVCRVWTVRVLRSFVETVDSVDSVRMDGSGDISAHWSLIKALNVNIRIFGSISLRKLPRL